MSISRAAWRNAEEKLPLPRCYDSVGTHQLVPRRNAAEKRADDVLLAKKNAGAKLPLPRRWRRRGDLNSRAALATYTLSRGASSTSLSTSPSRKYHEILLRGKPTARDIIPERSAIVKENFNFSAKAKQAPGGAAQRACRPRDKAKIRAPSTCNRSQRRPARPKAQSRNNTSSPRPKTRSAQSAQAEPHMWYKAAHNARPL